MLKQPKVTANANPEMLYAWAFPNPTTFSILPIRSLVKYYLSKSTFSVDPFARNNRWASITNDLSPDTSADFHLDALDFCKLIHIGALDTQAHPRPDLVLFDPPYSLEQCVRAYQSVGRTATMRDTQVFNRWTEHRKLISEFIAPGGIVISFGWNSRGMTATLGFEKIQVMVVCHGSAANDTLVTVDRKRIVTQGAMFQV